MKRGTPRHPKTAGLCESLKIPLYSGVGILELLWHFTAEFAPRGDIGRHSNEAIARACGWHGNADRLVRSLLECGWLEEDGAYRIVVHDWADHCDEATKKKLVRAKEDFVQKPAGIKTAWIYFIHAPHVNCIKIGFTEGSVASRLDQLQTGSAEQLVLVGQVEGTRYQESQLHKRWGAFREQGEWFKAEGTFLSYLQDTIQFGCRNFPKKPEQSDGVATRARALPEPEPEPEPEPPPSVLQQFGVSSSIKSSYKKSLSDDDEKTVPKSELTGWPAFRVRLCARHPAIDADAAIKLVKAELKSVVSVREFLARDELATTNPDGLRNPPGYYRALARCLNHEFRDALNGHGLAVPASAIETPRCAECRGAGRIAAGYCHCELGKLLLKYEQKGKKDAITPSGAA